MTKKAAEIPVYGEASDFESAIQRMRAALWDLNEPKTLGIMWLEQYSNVCFYDISLFVEASHTSYIVARIRLSDLYFIGFRVVVKGVAQQTWYVLAEQFDIDRTFVYPTIIHETELRGWNVVEIPMTGQYCGGHSMGSLVTVLDTKICRRTIDDAVWKMLKYSAGDLDLADLAKSSVVMAFALSEPMRFTWVSRGLAREWDTDGFIFDTKVKELINNWKTNSRYVKDNEDNGTERVMSKVTTDLDNLLKSFKVTHPGELIGLLSLRGGIDEEQKDEEDNKRARRNDTSIGGVVIKGRASLKGKEKKKHVEGKGKGKMYE